MSPAAGPDNEDELYESSITRCNMVYRLEGNALLPHEEYWGATPKHAMLKRNEKEIAELKPFDAAQMLPLNTSPVTLKLDGAHVGRGVKWSEDMQGFIKTQEIVTLEVTVWHVLEYEHCKLPELSRGQFHEGDTYVVRWQYMITNANLKSLKGSAARNSLTGRERCAYFFWQGNSSTINEKGASALMTVELDEERGPQVIETVLRGLNFLYDMGEELQIREVLSRDLFKIICLSSGMLYCTPGKY
ncbi:supervillin [Plakobranchus ocellatus]|uniref:Supervillin n=1 Tax=Plakobranchus ocellatus TaxID=259542 RepID=A0AAV4DGD6_9GAST|nr:supervillin [Plakobranchus ocellatus]